MPVIDTSDKPAAALSVPAVARLLGISRELAYDGVARGDLPSIRIGLRLLVPRVGLDALLAGAPPASR